MSIFEREIKCCNQYDFDSRYSTSDREAIYSKEEERNS